MNETLSLSVSKYALMPCLRDSREVGGITENEGTRKEHAYGYDRPEVQLSLLVRGTQTNVCRNTDSHVDLVEAVHEMRGSS